MSGEFGKITLKAHTINGRGYPSDEATLVEFEGRLLVDHCGFRGVCEVYQIRDGRLAFCHQSNIVAGEIIQIANSLTEARRFVDKQYPEFDPEVIEKVATALGIESPPKIL